jgi:TetR/AcrR family transcriptional regulator, tetracycline repressor protein
VATSREEVVSQGLALLDEVGLQGLSLRRLADRLGVKAPTIYWHVDNKRQLLDLIAERIVGEAYGTNLSVPNGMPWWEWLQERGVALRNGLLAHRDAALVLAGNRPSPAALPGVESQLAFLVGEGFTPGDALSALRSVGSYVIGYVIDVQREMARPESVARSDPPPRLDADRYPVLTEAIAAWRPGDARFDFGLRALVAGMRAGLCDRDVGGRPAAVGGSLATP